MVQRGNKRQPCSLNDDRQRYLHSRREVLCRFDCRLHVCVLISSHTHLLLTPCATGLFAEAQDDDVVAVMRAHPQQPKALERGTSGAWHGVLHKCIALARSGEG